MAAQLDASEGMKVRVPASASELGNVTVALIGSALANTTALKNQLSASASDIATAPINVVNCPTGEIAAVKPSKVAGAEALAVNNSLINGQVGISGSPVNVSGGQGSGGTKYFWG